MLHCNERKQKWKMRRLILKQMNRCREWKNNKVNKWILWVNNLKQILKQTTTTTEKKKQQSSCTNLKMRLIPFSNFFFFFFFFHLKWKFTWIVLAILQYSWKPLPLSQHWGCLPRQGHSDAHRCFSFSYCGKWRPGESRRLAGGHPGCWKEPKRRFGIFWVHFLFIQKCTFTAVCLDVEMACKLPHPLSSEAWLVCSLWIVVNRRHTSIAFLTRDRFKNS